MNSIIFRPFEDYDIDEDCRLIIRDKVKNTYILKKVISKREQHIIDIDKYHPYWNFKFKFQIRGIDSKTGEERWINATSYKILYPERIDANGLKYLLFEEPKSNQLLVIFQAINRNPSYNYVGTLSEYPINKLFIKDDYGKDQATKSSYYIGNNKDLYISNATQELIKNVTEDLFINKSDTVFIGSSKGGFGAIYHGYLFGAGHIIAGGPTILLGQQLSRQKEKNSISTKIFKSIIGEISDENIEWADNLMKDAISNSQIPHPSVNIHVGFWDSFYQNHVVPFMELININDINNVELNIKPYRKHSDLATHFPPFLKKKLDEIIK